MRRKRALIVLAVAAASIGSLLPSAPVGASPVASAASSSPRAPKLAPACTPAAPAVVGSAGDRLTVTVPPCANQTGVTGYRVVALAGAAETAAGQTDVGLGAGQIEVTGLSAGTLYRFRVAARNADGAGPLSARSGDATPPFTSIGAMVDRQYLDFNGGAATAAQRSAWIADIASGAKTPVDLVDAAEGFAFWQKQSPIIRLFQAYFLRLPDKSGLTYWVGKYRGGKKLSEISQSFASSSEFTRRYGSLTNRKFVEQIYVNVLGRAGEESGIAYWTGKLDSKSRNRGEVMVGFSESSEYVRKTAEQVSVVNLFTGMVLRLPTTAEVTTWKPLGRPATIRFLLASATYVARVGVVAPLVVATAPLPAGTVGTAYSTQLTSVGGTGSTTWYVSAGALPLGLDLSLDGAIAGIPAGGGTFTFTVTVEDDGGSTATKQLSITIPALSVSTPSLPAGTITSPYPSTQLTATNMYLSGTWTVSAGSLPAGLSLSDAGVISGTPTAGGTSTFTVRVEDGGSNVATKQLSITVSSFAIVTAQVPGGYTSVPYAVPLVAAGGTGYSWSITVGSLPAGLTLGASTGVISGTPSGSGSATFTARVDAAGGKNASRQFTIAVSAAADWPQPNHDETGRGWSPNETAIDSSNVAGIGEEWSVQAALQPVIAGNLAYAAGEVPGRDGTFAAMALDLNTGEVVWYGPSLPDGCSSGPVAVTATAVIVQCNTLVAYQRTGSHSLLWNTAITDPGVTTQYVLIAGTTAVTWTNDRVLAYRLSDGQRLWQQLVPSGATGLEDVAASGTTVVVAYNDRLRALSLTTGAQLWSRAMARPGEVFIADGWAYTRSGDGVSRFALADGTPGWSVLAGSGIYQLVGADADTVYAFEATFSDFGQTSAVLRALKASDGTQRWEAQLGTRIRAAGITKDLVWILESQIYSWGRDSNMIAFRRTDGVERKRLHFDDNSYGTAVFSNGHVLFSQGGSFGGPDPYRLRSYGFTPPTPIITSKMVPTGRVSAPYSTTLTATGGTGSLTWSLASGTLPAGLTLSSVGVLSGTPSAAGAVRVQVRVTDAQGRARTRSLYAQINAAGTNSWSGEGRDGSRGGYNSAETTIARDAAAQLAYRWITATPAGTEAYAVADHEPVVVGTKVVDVDKIGRLVAYDTAGTATNRLPVWNRPALAGATYPDAPMESGGVLYLFDSNRKLDAIRLSDGARLWQVTPATAPTQYQRNELLVVGTKILFLDASYDMVAYNTSDGSAAWGGTAVTLDGNELSGSVVLASDGTRAFALANCEVKAVTISSGAVAWTVPVKAGGSTNCGTAGRSRPMVADGAVLASTFDGSIAIEAATGVVRWRSGTRYGYGSYAGGGAVANGVWVMDNGAYDDGNLVALDLASGEVLWNSGSLGSSEGLSISGDLIVGRGYYNGVSGYDLLTGEKIWDGGNADVSNYANGAPAIAAGKIFLSTREGIKAYGLP